MKAEDTENGYECETVLVRGIVFDFEKEFEPGKWLEGVKCFDSS
jgi:hypothetical protein